MSTSRRRFLAGSVAALAASRAAAADSTAEADSTQDDGTVDCLDYGLSFICNTAAFNAVRFWVESRTTIIDDSSGTTHEFLQCGSCKSEHTFAEQGLFIEDNYDFLPILGGDEWLIFRRPARLSDNYRQVRSTDDVWGKPIRRLHKAKRARELNDWAQIRDATASGTPLVSQTVIADEQSGLSAIIECPVKTMNVSLDHKKYQVDTGPIALPDLTKRHEALIESLSLAFIAFNAPHFADFVVEQPTPMVEEGREVTKIYHYSNPFSLPARNRLIAVEQ